MSDNLSCFVSRALASRRAPASSSPPPPPRFRNLTPARIVSLSTGPAPTVAVCTRAEADDAWQPLPVSPYVPANAPGSLRAVPQLPVEPQPPLAPQPLVVQHLPAAQPPPVVPQPPVVQHVPNAAQQQFIAQLAPLPNLSKLSVPELFGLLHECLREGEAFKALGDPPPTPPPTPWWSSISGFFTASQSALALSAPAPSTPVASTSAPSTFAPSTHASFAHAPSPLAPSTLAPSTPVALSTPKMAPSGTISRPNTNLHSPGPQETRSRPNTNLHSGHAHLGTRSRPNTHDSAGPKTRTERAPRTRGLAGEPETRREGRRLRQHESERRKRTLMDEVDDFDFGAIDLSEAGIDEELQRPQRRRASSTSTVRPTRAQLARAMDRDARVATPTPTPTPTTSPTPSPTPTPTPPPTPTPIPPSLAAHPPVRDPQPDVGALIQEPVRHTPVAPTRMTALDVLQAVAEANRRPGGFWPIVSALFGPRRAVPPPRRVVRQDPPLDPPWSWRRWFRRRRSEPP